MDDPKPSPKPDADEPKVFATLLGGGLVLLALCGWMGWEFYTAAGSLTWPTTEGTVRAMKVWEKVPLGAGNKSWQIEITYEYTVGGQTYTGQTFNSRNNHIDESAIPAIRQRYAVGSRCQVAYSPTFPGRSILVRGVSVSAWGKLGIAVAALGGAVYCLIYAFRKPRATAEPTAALDR